MQAGGRPMTVPDTIPKRITKARAAPRVLVRGQKVKIKMDEIAVDIRWTFKAPKL